VREALVRNRARVFWVSGFFFFFLRYSVIEIESCQELIGATAHDYESLISTILKG